jgi:hypothetical protein
MAEGPGVSSAPALSDRASALKVFGWGEIVLGALGVLFSGLILLAVRFQTPTGTNLLPSLLIYPLFGAALITLGIGSIRARRWSRGLLLIWGWLWLVGGALGLLTVTLTTPRILRETSGQESSACLLLPIFLVGAVMFILIPLALVLFYGRRDVKATVEARDPGPSWTDRSPLPLLGTSLVLGVGSISSILLVPTWQALPLFGYLIRGWPAILIGVVFGILGAALALAIFRRNPIGWWGLLVLQLISLANVLTLQSLNPSELLSAMGYSAEEAAAASRFNMWADPAMQGIMVLCWISTLVFIFWTRKFYRFGEQSPSDAPH